MRVLAERLLQTIRKQATIRAGDRVAAAISGGADSVALLCLLLELRAELGIVLSVAHVNHKLRGEESDEDARFVAQLAQQHRLELHVCEAPVDGRQSPADHAAKSSGIEAAARELRYSFFRQLAQEGRVTRIATAHTLDDQAETVLLRIFRGTGIRGLSGIHPRITFEEQGRAFGELVRPLLGFRRAALQEFLREQGQSWREDSSNRDIAFLRNRVRHRLLSIIVEEFGEAAIEHMGELAEIARAEEEQWSVAGGQWPASTHSVSSTQYSVPSIQQTAAGIAAQLPAPAKEVTGRVGVVSGYRFGDTASSSKSDAPLGAMTRPAASLQLRPLLALPLAAQRRLVRGWLETNAPDLSISFRLIEETLELAQGAAGRRLELPGDLNRALCLRRARQELRLEANPPGTRNEARHRQAADYDYALAVPGAVKVPELSARVEARVVDADGVPEDERGQLLDAERVPKHLLIRNWRAGDRYWPAHTSVARKVKELLSDRHATGAEKKLWPVAVAEGCGLIWMRGFAVPAAFRAPAGASKAIWIREIAG